MPNTIQWLDNCLQPFSGNDICGRDVTYDDDFEQIKQEVEKLDNCDYELIYKKSTSLLANSSKDLRLAGYLCLALCKTQSIKGLQSGLEYYLKLLMQYKEQLYPKNPIAKESAISWLNNPKFLPGLNGINLSHAARDELRATINKLNNCIKEQSESYKSFKILNNWLSAQTIEKPALPTPVVIKETAQVDSLDDEKHTHDLQIKIIKYWQKDKNWEKSCALSRAHLWSDLELPAHKNSKTDVQPPRKEALKQLEIASSKLASEELLALCEDLFLEPSGKFNLDLQWHAHQAATLMQKHALACYLLDKTRSLCQKHPQILNLSFANKIPFASNHTKTWLHQPVPKARDEIKSSACNFLQQARNCEDLASTLTTLDGLKARSTLETIHILQAKAQACIQAKQHEMGIIYYKELISIMDSKNIEAWLPEDAMLIWQDIYTYLSRHHKINTTIDIIEISNNIKTKMLLTNSQKACQLLT